MMKTSVRASEIPAKMGRAAVFRNPKAAFYTILDVIFFHQTGESLYPVEIVYDK